jgi:DNA-binding LytR/AlgR family response regulator
MTTAIVIEDEKPACQYLLNRLKVIAPDIEVKATLSDIQQSIDYLSKNADSVDIVFSDVQLPDGLSFTIFNQLHTDLPVIFITGYDRFMMNAFDCNGIDYLLKPVNDEDLLRSIEKYRKLEKHFTSGKQQIKSLLQYINAKKKTRLIVKRGHEHIFLLMDDVVLFYTENKVVFVIDKNGKKYLTDKNLCDLEHELDTETFFRANRQYIINVNYIRSFKTYERVKLQLDLNVSNLNHCVIISQETAPLFKKWIYQA